jgi:hypothetical protein
MSATENKAVLPSRLPLSRLRVPLTPVIPEAPPAARSIP